MEALLRARVAQHLAQQRPRIPAEFVEAGVLALQAVQRDEGDTPISLPTGQIKRAQTVIEVLNLTSLALDV